MDSYEQLSKNLEKEFSKGSNDKNSSKPEISNILQDSIDRFISEHNTFESLEDNKISDKLYKIYRYYIAKGSNKETVFLQILIQLIPYIIDEADHKLWTQKYLNHSVDAAGLQIEYVDLCTQLIETVMLHAPELEDKKLVKIIGDYSLDMFRELVDGYIEVDAEANDSQESEERARYKLVRLTNMILKFASQRPKDFTEVFDSYITTSTERVPRVLSLLSTVIKDIPSHIPILITSKVFNDLINLGILEKSAGDIQLVVNILYMVIPHIVERIRDYLPHLLVLFARLIMFDDRDFTAEIDGELLQLDFSDEDSNQEIPLPEIACIRYSMLIYGLYPLNYTQFTTQPNEYLEQFNSRLLNFKEGIFLERALDFQERHAKFHPNFMKFHSAEEELNDTARFKAMGSPEDISMFCSSVTLPETYLPSQKRLSVTETLATEPATPLLKSKQSLTSPPVFNTPVFQQQTTISARLNSDTETDTLNDSLTEKQNNYNDMLDIRKQLFSKVSESPEFTRRYSLISPTEMSTRTFSDAVGSKLNSKDGSAVDFYQRELLIIKNELDFAEYTRDVSIMKFEKAKEQMRQQELRLQSYDSLQNELQVLRDEITRLNENPVPNSQTPEVLLESSRRLYNKNQELEEDLMMMERKYEQEKLKIEAIKDNVIEKEVLNSRLKFSVQYLEEALASLKARQDIHPLGYEKFERHEESSIIPEKERAIIELNQQVERLKLQYAKSLGSLQADYESKVKNLQHQLSIATKSKISQTNKIVQEIIANNDEQVKGLQDMNRNLMKELEEKENTIRELTTARPISIRGSESKGPLLGSPQKNSVSSGEFYGGPGFKEHLFVPPEPQKPLPFIAFTRHSHSSGSTSSDIYRGSHVGQGQSFSKYFGKSIPKSPSALETMGPGAFKLTGRGGIQQKKSKLKM